jgi:hypothetical protein
MVFLRSLFNGGKNVRDCHLNRESVRRFVQPS